MRALIFAAGFGKRLAPLTDNTPKPLVDVNGKPLIQYHIENLVSAGVTELVINSHWLADKLVDALGDGNRFGAKISWSHEPEILNTGGGMKHALPLLGSQPFLVVNADIWTDYPFEHLIDRTVHPQGAHLVMVPNPKQHAGGDFELSEQGMLVMNQGLPKYTYSGIGLYSPGFIADFHCDEVDFPLLLPLRQAIQSEHISAEVYRGDWQDIGTIERLEALRAKQASI